MLRQEVEIEVFEDEARTSCSDLQIISEKRFSTMKAIIALTQEKHKEYSDIQTNLYNRIQGHSLDELLQFNRRTGDAHYRFEGSFTDKLVELLGRTPTPEEIIILVDGGFSHFGADCHISGHNFSGKLNTD